jgi:hypothetical protein
MAYADWNQRRFVRPIKYGTAMSVKNGVNLLTGEVTIHPGVDLRDWRTYN